MAAPCRACIRSAHQIRCASADRIQPQILDFAANPLRMHRFWTEADHPWLFLAACLEWKRYKEEGPGMISHLPISMDGSCNGYQHLSAMGLDPIGGRATNLLPREARARAERERDSAKPLVMD